jgi:phosphoribosylanthranilate isomerase
MTIRLEPRADATALVKICGLRREQDIMAAIEAGADLLGLVFAPSRRQITVDTAKALVQCAAGMVPVVGVFVNETVEAMNRVIDETGIAFVQLSGEEPPDALSGLAAPWIKTVHTRAGANESDLLHIMNSYRDSTAILIDAWSPAGGGGGITADWAIARRLKDLASVPLMVAGGLTPSNVGEALRLTEAIGVDVSSGVEQDGSKDPALIRTFVRAVRATAVVARGHS